MSTRVAVVALVASLSLAVVTDAQTVTRFLDPSSGVSLEQAVAQALEHEPSLRAAKTLGEEARGMRVQAGLRPNPTVSFAQQQEPAGTDSQTRVDVQWPLDLFRKTGRVHVADREVEAVQHATEDRERSLAADVRLKYGEVAAAVRDLSVSDELVAATRRQLELVSARVEQGATPTIDRDMLRVELQRMQSDRVLHTGRAEQALIELKRLLGLAPDALLTLSENIEQLVERDTAVSTEGGSVVGERPDVREAETRVHAAEARIDQARRAGKFDVSLFGMYMRADAGFPQRAFGPRNDLERVRGVFHYLAGGAMVTVPLRNRNQGDVAAAEARRSGAAATLEARRLTAQAEIAAARALDERARQAVASYTSDTRALSKQNLDVVRQTYELGRLTLFDVLAEQRRYLDVERAYTNALREAHEARQALRRALGEVR